MAARAQARQARQAQARMYLGMAAGIVWYGMRSGAGTVQMTARAALERRGAACCGCEWA